MPRPTFSSRALSLYLYLAGEKAQLGLGERAH